MTLSGRHAHLRSFAAVAACVYAAFLSRDAIGQAPMPDLDSPLLFDALDGQGQEVPGLVFSAGNAARPLAERKGLQIISTAVFPETRNSYWLVSVTDFLTAYHVATDNGGMLWEINSLDEQDFILDSFRNPAAEFRQEYIVPAGFDGAGTASTSGGVWVGLTDSEFFGATEDSPGNTGENFQWISGLPRSEGYTNPSWGTGEPNDFDTGEDYLEVSFGGGWNDDNDRESGLDLGLDGLPETTPTAARRLPGGGGNLAVIEFDPVPLPATLVIDPETGYAEIVPNPDFLLDRNGVSFGEPLNVRSYELTANDGLLSDAAWGASNLSAQQTGEPATGEGWDPIVSDAQTLLEASLLGGSSVEGDETLFIGQVATPLPDGMTVEQAGLNFSLVVDTPDPSIPGTQTELELEIVFAEVAAPEGFNPGDYNADGVVDAADYTVWRSEQGQAGESLMADGNADGEVDNEDLQLWSANYGRTLDEPAASTPEPTAVCLLLAGCLAAATPRRTAIDD